MAAHSRVLAWKIPWTEEPGGLQSMGSQRVGDDSATSLSLFTFMHWRRKWQPTPVFLPGKFHGSRNQAGYSPWGRKESDPTEPLTLSLFPWYGLGLWLHHKKAAMGHICGQKMYPTPFTSHPSTFHSMGSMRGFVCFTKFRRICYHLLLWDIVASCLLRTQTFEMWNNWQ